MLSRTNSKLSKTINLNTKHKIFTLLSRSSDSSGYVKHLCNVTTCNISFYTCTIKHNTVCVLVCVPRSYFIFIFFSQDSGKYDNRYRMNGAVVGCDGTSATAGINLAGYIALLDVTRHKPSY